ncbi:MAG: ABC transporter substrate-binding protein [Lachnospiraceae bacterium]|nr:ABC transporter substrate-binding protein [Lachnospiraceae bacterium]
MKRKLRRLSAVLLAASMVMTGCGATESSGKATTTTIAKNETAKSETIKSDEKITIEYWHCNAEAQGGAAVEELVSKFNEENDHIEVIAKYNPDMYAGLMKNLQAEVAVGNTPAVVQIGWSYLEYFSNNFSYLTPQDAIAKYDAENSTYLTDNFLPNILNLAVNTAGEQVGIPYSLSSPVLYYNVDLFREAGLSEEGPQTWEQVYEYSKIINEKTGKYGCYIEDDNWGAQALLESNGAQFIATDEAGNMYTDIASEGGIEAMQMWADMIAEGLIPHVTWDEGCQAFNAGEVAMLYTTIARRASVQSTAQFEAAAVNSPVWEGKERVIPAGGCMLAITAQEEEEQAAAWEFMKYLYSIEGMATWTIGTGYVPPRKDVADSPEGLKSFLEENEMMKAATTQMDGVVSWASFPGDAGLEIDQILSDTQDQILGGSITAKDGLAAAQDKINALLGN